MTDPHDEQSSTTDEPITTERREFLRSLGNRKNLGFGLTSPILIKPLEPVPPLYET